MGRGGERYASILVAIAQLAVCFIDMLIYINNNDDRDSEKRRIPDVSLESKGVSPYSYTVFNRSFFDQMTLSNRDKTIPKIVQDLAHAAAANCFLRVFSLRVFLHLSKPRSRSPAPSITRWRAISVLLDDCVPRTIDVVFDVLVGERPL